MSDSIEQLFLASQDGVVVSKALVATISEADAQDPSAVAWYERAAVLLATVVDACASIKGDDFFERRSDLVRSLLPLPALEAQYLVFHHMFAGRHPNEWPKGAAALHRYFSRFLPTYSLDRLIGEGIGKSTLISKDQHYYCEQLVLAFLNAGSPKTEQALRHGVQS